jgi:hypothetical protein
MTETAVTKRAEMLGQLLGISLQNASDTSLKGRLAVISSLRTARLAEVKRGQDGSWLYDLNRHFTICQLLREEYESLADSLDAVDGLIWTRSAGSQNEGRVTVS